MSNWPLDAPIRAWAPPAGEREAVAIPLFPEDKVLDWDQYRQRLRARIKWMAEADQDPRRTVENMWWDQMGHLYQLDTRVPLDQQMVEEGGELLQVLAEVQGLRPEMFPLEVEAEAESDMEDPAVEAVGGQELNLWLVAVLPESDR